jgi:hypothetical protein
VLHRRVRDEGDGHSAQGAAAPDAGGAGPKLDPDGERPRCARIVRITAGSWQILLSARVASGVEDLIEAEAIEALTLKGFARPVHAFNVLRLKSPA